MSSLGVTHFVSDQPAFTELRRWRQEYEVFMDIVKIKVFRQYPLWKPFKKMKLVTHYGIMARNGDKLERHLFWMDSTFRSAILRVRRNCADISRHSLHSLKPNQLYRLEDFYSEQQLQRKTVRPCCPALPPPAPSQATLYRNSLRSFGAPYSV